MVMAAWPADFPQSPARDFSSNLMGGLSAGEDEFSQRRTRTYPEHDAVFTFPQCTVAQLQSLRTFYNDTLNQTQPFSAPWLEAAGFDHHFCTLSSAPKASRSGMNWDVSIEVVIYSGVPVDSEGVITYGAVD